MAKLIFLEDKKEYKKGEIVNGFIGDKGEVFIYGDYSYISDEEHRKFLEKYFAIRYPYGYPVMKLEDFREQQIKTVLDV
jgi:hypothetical protein